MELTAQLQAHRHAERLGDHNATQRSMAPRVHASPVCLVNFSG